MQRSSDAGDVDEQTVQPSSSVENCVEATDQPSNPPDKRLNSPKPISKNKPTPEEKRAALNIFADVETPGSKPLRDAENPRPKFLRGSEAATLGTTYSKPLGGSPRGKAKNVIQQLATPDRRKLRRRVFFLESGGWFQRKPRHEQLLEVRDQLERLQRHTRVWAGRSLARKDILVPEETIALLAGITEPTLVEDMWYVPVHNGCRIHVLDPMHCEGRFRKVRLTGSPKVVDLVATRIRRLQQDQADGDPLIDIMSPIIPVYPSADVARRKGLSVPIIRGVWDFRWARLGKNIRHVLPSLDTLSSVKDFNEFVEDLTRSRRGRYRQSDPKGHLNRITRILVRLFRDEDKFNFISTASLNRALQFLYQHEARDSARKVFLRGKDVATVTTFNILLKASAKSLNMLSFRSTLNMMSRLGIRPNEWTWLIFLDCHVSGKAKASLLSHITQKGYLTRESARSMLHLTIQGAFSSHLASGKDVDSFFNKMTDEYGAEWVGLAIINQMVSVTSRRGDRSAMDRLLTICTEERLPVGGSTIIQMVPLLRKNPRLLMVYTLKVMENPGVRLDGHAFEQLFKVAYKSQSYNICRVLWQYACFYKKVTSKMKAIVLDSLSCHKEPSWGNPISKRFELHAGKVIVGAAPDTGPKKSHTASFLRSDLADELPAEFRHKPLLYLVEAVKHRGFDPELQRSVARALVNHDVESGGDYNPVMSMPLMFEAAFEIDQDWGRSPRPLHWLLQNVLAIPAEQKQRGLPESVLSEGIS